MSDQPVALVTGGATGIGAACCRRLAAEGFRVGVHYRSSEEKAKKLVAELGDGFSVRAEARVGLEVGSVRRDGPAAHIGLRAGDTILGLAGMQTKTIEEFRRRLVDARFNQTILLSVARGANEYHVTLPLDPG